MAEFDQTRAQIRKSRQERDDAQAALAAVRERLKRLAAQAAELDRVFQPNDRRAIAERARLAREKQAAEAERQRLNDARKASLDAESAALKDWVRFSDPREGIAQLNDDTPILLMPVRLETRFKTAAAVGERAPIQQLWVRIYPDDCWIDTFDATLTETEVANAKAYWSALWQAGGIEDQMRGAWRALATSHGSGRAAWIVQQFQPANVAAPPTKTRPQDVILVIPTETALPAAEAAATAVYWRDLWLADGAAAASAAVQHAFEVAVGTAARAAEIAAQYQPTNFASPLAKGFSKEDVFVRVAFVVFTPIDTKQSAWSQAPKMTILPDRFVFIGDDGSAAPLVAVGNAVPSPLYAGPDPSAPKAAQLQHDARGDLQMPDELKWMSDFDRAVEVGMGFRINLTPVQARGGFKRVLVVGLRINADKDAAKVELETLLRHHAYSRTGLALVPQGTPTNNTEALPAGHSRLDDPDQSYDDAQAPQFTSAPGWLDKKDGQWLAEFLGIDSALFANTHSAGGTDQIAARAMHAALWPTTLGYWMETMMAPVFSRDAIERTRDFFTQFVIAGGAVPALRIGNQPYGILPATALSRMTWLNARGRAEVIFAPDPTLLFLRGLHPILKAIDDDWRNIVPQLSFTAKPNADPHKTLLDIVGLHSGSVEWSQRYAESLQTLYNRLNLLGFGGFIAEIILAAQRAASRGLLTTLGYTGTTDPPILDKVFSGAHNLLTGGVVDDKPLSETTPIRPFTTAGQNYIQWLIDAAGSSLDALYQQNGFKDDQPPGAILYLMLRHALQLGYHDVSVRLHETAGLFTAEMALAARSDSPFLHVQTNNAPSESRYQTLYAVAPQITGNSVQPIHQFIASRLFTPTFTFYLARQLEALERLKLEPTARLERVFADHVDCCSYRLDAWLLGIVNYQLTQMRGIRDGSDAAPRQGIYLGAYAWLEDLKPENKVMEPMPLQDPELAADFGGKNEPTLMRDSANEGFIHAPSLNHAVAAAVLRNGFLSNASPQNRQTMAVNLTSERVRVALGLIEGIRAGQSLTDLLGYQFERGLHDRHNLAEVDQFIYKLRKAFPLRADRLDSTKTDEGVPIEAIEARNVIDGLALAEHIKTSGQAAYPFGKTGLPTPSTAQAAAINAEANRLLDSYDAVADLALSEGVYQAVLGNYDRVASTYDAYARGNFPPEPDVIRTPFNGIGLTHRVALHLDAGADPTVSPIGGIAMTPRAMAEPALNAWLAGMLPPLGQVACVATFRQAAGGMTSEQIALGDLGLQPADLLAIIHDDPRQAMTELDDRIVGHVFAHFAPRPDAPVEIAYLKKTTAPYSVFEVMPLMRKLRILCTKSRPLQATDLTLMNEARTKQDAQPFVDVQRPALARAALQTLRNDLAALETLLAGPLDDLTNRRGEILTDADNYVNDLMPLLMRAATFAMVQAGAGFAFDFKRRAFSAILKQAADLVTKWDQKLVEFAAKIAAAAAAATDAEKFDLLTQAERLISTSATVPLPATPAAYQTSLETIAKPAFVAKRNQFAGLQNTTRTEVTLLLADTAAFLPISDFDAVAFSLTPREDEMVRFAQDARNVLKTLLADSDRRLKTSLDLLAAHAAAAAATDQVKALEDAAKALLGADFRIFPEFSLSAGAGDELANALAASQSGELFQFLTNPPPGTAIDALDFPVDTWLYGIARVRDKMNAWEQVVMFAGSLGVTEPVLDVMQLPFQPGERWYALEFPPEQILNKDHLLYTAHFATSFDKAKRQCGLLLDEWSELIPGETADTGVAFHYDRPNCEAPQSMLLVTPTEFRGAWQWQDLVAALNETLDFAKRRAIEPTHIDATPYAPFLPATLMASQVHQLTIAANLGLNNKVAALLRSN